MDIANINIVYIIVSSQYKSNILQSIEIKMFKACYHFDFCASSNFC